MFESAAGGLGNPGEVPLKVVIDAIDAHVTNARSCADGGYTNMPSFGTIAQSLPHSFSQRVVGRQEVVGKMAHLCRDVQTTQEIFR